MHNAHSLDNSISLLYQCVCVLPLLVRANVKPRFELVGVRYFQPEMTDVRQVRAKARVLLTLSRERRSSYVVERYVALWAGSFIRLAWLTMSFASSCRSRKTLHSHENLSTSK